MSSLNSVGNIIVNSISGINLSNLKIKNLATCTDPSDLANKLYVDSRFLGAVTNIGAGAPVIKIVQGASTVFVRSIVGNGYTTANDPTQVYLNYDLYDVSFPQNVLNSTSVAVPNLTDKWSGAVLAKDGKIYGVPSSYTSAFIYDTYTGSGGGVLDTTTLTGSGIVGNSGWFGGVLAPNGKIYCVPYNASNVLIIDPINKTTDTTSLTGLTGTTKWIGGCLAPNGKIYCIPYTSSSVLVIDPVANTLDTSSLAGLSGTNKWRGGVLSPAGSIYCAPADTTRMLIINTVAGTLNTTSIVGFTANTNKWACGCLAPNNGTIYFMPNAETRALIVNPNGNILNTTSITANFAGNKWFGASVGANGNIFCAPQATSQMLIINPVANTSTRTLIAGFATGGSAFMGGVLAPNGNVYIIPDDSTYIGVVGTGILNVQLLQAFSAYYNKL